MSFQLTICTRRKRGAVEISDVTNASKVGYNDIRVTWRTHANLTGSFEKNGLNQDMIITNGHWKNQGA